MARKDRRGVLRLRFCLKREDMDAFSRLDATESATPLPPGAFTEEGLRLTGTLNPAAMRPQIRPVFPGLARFRAIDPLPFKTVAEIRSRDGVVDEAQLEQLDGMKGWLVVSADIYQDELRGRDGADAKAPAQKGVPPYRPPAGFVPGLDAAPSTAWYGPVELSTGFLRDALLDPVEGLQRDVIDPGGANVAITSEAWAPTALFRFLNGTHAVRLRGRGPEDGLRDDAARLPMPRIATTVKGSREIVFDIAFGWLRQGNLPPAKPGREVEIVPARLFLQAIAARMCDLPKEAAKMHTVAREILAGQLDASKWLKATSDSLSSMGFEPLVQGRVHPLGHKVREFQIAAQHPFAAKLRAGAASGSRSMKDLTCTANPARYAGPVSGRLNRDTRAALAKWTKSGLRNPLLIIPFALKDLDAVGLPLAGAKPKQADVWLRDDHKTESDRMFAGDVAALGREGAMLASRDLSQIGHYYVYKSSLTGPQGIDPQKEHYTVTRSAEIRPKAMFMESDADLLRPLAARDADLRRRRRESTFRVIRAVSEVECFGYLDEVNAYDAGLLSIGAFHWASKGSGDAMNPGGKGTELGGLAAYLAYLDDITKSNAADVFYRNGTTFKQRGGGLKDTAAWRSSRLLYQTQLTMMDDLGRSRPGNADDYTEYLPSWRSVRRNVDAARTLAPFMQAMWHATRRRLHGLMTEVRFDERTRPADPRFATAPTLGDVFTSELCVAKILRLHVNKPEVVLDTAAKGLGHPAAGLVKAYRYAAGLRLDPKDADGWQKALSKGLSDAVAGDANLTSDLEMLEAAPWILEPADPFDDSAIVAARQGTHFALDPNLRRLKRRAGSFLLDDDFPDPRKE